MSPPAALVETGCFSLYRNAMFMSCRTYRDFPTTSQQVIVGQSYAPPLFLNAPIIANREPTKRPSFRSNALIQLQRACVNFVHYNYKDTWLKDMPWGHVTAGMERVVKFYTQVNVL